MVDRTSDDILQLFCEKNSDRTKSLRLKGRELIYRYGKPLDSTDMVKVSEFMVAHPDVYDLNLCYNNICDKGISFFRVNYLKSDNNLRHLNLAACSLTYRSVEHLAIAVENLTHLETLRLYGNKLGSESGKYLSIILERTPKLSHLDVGDTDQTLSSVPYILAPLRSDMGDNQTLQVLDVSRIIPSSCYYQYDAGHLAEQIGDTLKMNTGLREVHFQKCEFDGHDIERMLLGMHYNKTLAMLDLGNNRMGDHGIELLALWLRTRPNLVGLNVSGNGIRETGCKSLSFHLPFSKVRLLDIARNRINDIGMVHLLLTLKKAYKLRVLFIWGNPITETTLKVIHRLIGSEVLNPEHMDIRLYSVDGVLCHAFVPEDHYKHRYYDVMDHGCAVDLKIKRNVLENEYSHPRNLTDFKFYPKYPAAPDSPRRPIC